MCVLQAGHKCLHLCIFRRPLRGKCGGVLLRYTCSHVVYLTQLPAVLCSLCLLLLLLLLPSCALFFQRCSERQNLAGPLGLCLCLRLCLCQCLRLCQCLCLRLCVSGSACTPRPSQSSSSSSSSLQRRHLLLQSRHLRCVHVGRLVVSETATAAGFLCQRHHFLRVAICALT